MFLVLTCRVKVPVRRDCTWNSEGLSFVNRHAPVAAEQIQLPLAVLIFHHVRHLMGRSARRAKLQGFHFLQKDRLGCLFHHCSGSNRGTFCFCTSLSLSRHSSPQTVFTPPSVCRASRRLQRSAPQAAQDDQDDWC